MRKSIDYGICKIMNRDYLQLVIANFDLYMAMRDEEFCRAVAATRIVYRSGPLGLTIQRPWGHELMADVLFAAFTFDGMTNGFHYWSTACAALRNGSVHFKDEDRIELTRLLLFGKDMGHRVAEFRLAEVEAGFRSIRNTIRILQVVREAKERKL